jgi:hypothetical protein
MDEHGHRRKEMRRDMAAKSKRSALSLADTQVTAGRCFVEDESQPAGKTKAAQIRLAVKSRAANCRVAAIPAIAQ